MQVEVLAISQWKDNNKLHVPSQTMAMRVTQHICTYSIALRMGR